MSEESMRENLADLCHRQWTGWMEYLLSKSIPYKPGDVQGSEGAYLIPKWAVAHWTRLMSTPYTELTRADKESNREEAEQFIEVLVARMD